jgi:uncharacterized protein (DUF1330 family)
MPAYVIAEIEVTDADTYKDYMAASPGAVAAGGGTFIVRGGETVPLEGGWEPARIVVLEFPDLDAATRWYHSDAYQAAKTLREGAARFRAIAVAGTD